MTPIVRDDSGRLLKKKAEGLIFDTDRSGSAYIVIDSDDHELPSELLELELGGPWFENFQI